MCDIQSITVSIFIVYTVDLTASVMAWCNRLSELLCQIGTHYSLTTVVKFNCRHLVFGSSQVVVFWHRWWLHGVCVWYCIKRAYLIHTVCTLCIYQKLDFAEIFHPLLAFLAKFSNEMIIDLGEIRLGD